MDLGGGWARTTSSVYETSEGARHFSNVKSGVGSRWMAFVEKQKKNTTYLFVMRKALSVYFFYIKRAGVVHSCVREQKTHSLFPFVDNADFTGANHCLHQVLFYRNAVSGPGERYHHVMQ